MQCESCKMIGPMMICRSCTTGSDCNDCDVGSFWSVESNACVMNCEEGTYGNTETNTCESCMTSGPDKEWTCE